MLDAFRIRRGTAHLLVLAIVAGALFLRILVPQGWMPVETGGGWRITLCSGTGPMTMDMPGSTASAMKGMHDGHGRQDGGSADHPCAYSSLAMALDEPPPLILDLPRPLIETWGAATGIEVAIGRGLAAPPPPSTGPPLA